MRYGAMMKQLSICIVLFWLSSTAQAQHVIKPFGNLLWDDSFTSAAMKIVNMPGIESCEVHFLGRRAPLRGKDANFFSDVPGRLISQPASGIFDIIPARQVEIYTDRAGRKHKYITNAEFEIVAYPVMICDVPFRLAATFEMNPGLFLVSPRNSLKAKDGSYLPLVLKNVILFSDSKALRLKYTEISGVIAAKYAPGKQLAGTSMATADSHGTYLSTYLNSSTCRIEYGANSGSAYSKYLHNRYHSYVSSLTVKAGQGKRDLSSGL